MRGMTISLAFHADGRFHMGLNTPAGEHQHPRQVEARVGEQRHPVRPQPAARRVHRAHRDGGDRRGHPDDGRLDGTKVVFTKIDKEMEHGAEEAGQADLHPRHPAEEEPEGAAGGGAHGQLQVKTFFAATSGSGYPLPLVAAKSPFPRCIPRPHPVHFKCSPRTRPDDDSRSSGSDLLPAEAPPMPRSFRLAAAVLLVLPLVARADAPKVTGLSAFPAKLTLTGTDDAAAARLRRPRLRQADRPDRRHPVRRGRHEDGPRHDDRPGDSRWRTARPRSSPRSAASRLRGAGARRSTSDENAADQLRQPDRADLHQARLQQRRLPRQGRAGRTASTCRCSASSPSSTTRRS